MSLVHVVQVKSINTATANCLEPCNQLPPPWLAAAKPQASFAGTALMEKQTDANYITVAVGVVLDGDKTYVTRRLSHQHQGGKWEFPGGKLKPDETGLQGLSRELEEEIGIVVKEATPLTEIAHQYPDKSVLLSVYTVTDYSGEPSGREGQEGRWIAFSDLGDYDFPEANAAVIAHLQAR